MNIAFPALLITILILPGILFYYSYSRGVLPENIVIQNQIVVGIILSIPINLLAIEIVEFLPFWNVDFEVVVALLTGWRVEEANYVQENISAIAENVKPILLYLFLLNALSLLVGTIAHKLVRYYRLDLRFDFLRQSYTEWYYFISGSDFIMSKLIEEKVQVERKDREQKKEQEQDPDTDSVFKVKKWRISAAEIKAKEKEIDLHIVAATMELGGKVYIYRGVLDQYFFDKEGNLDRMVILYPQRRLIEDDPVEEDGSRDTDINRFYQIESHYFVIEYKRVLNLNYYYYRYTDTASV